MTEYTEHDIDIVARTVYGEARGESRLGQAAVAWVIRNRATLAFNRKQFGDGTAAGAALAPWQFSTWNANDPNSAALKAMKASDPKLAPFRQIAEGVLKGTTPDPTGGATFYYADYIGTPTWARGKRPCAVIGRHKFFKDIR